MNQNKIAIAATEAKAKGQHLVEVGIAPDRSVMMQVMKAARASFMAPTEDEAFVASIAAIVEIFPKLKEVVMEESRRLGELNSLMSALVAGVPVDLDALAMPELPEGAIGLMKLWEESKTA